MIRVRLFCIIAVVLLIASTSCVKKTEYEELAERYESLEREYAECKEERDEFYDALMEKEEEIEELETNISAMQDAMREVVSNYNFYGAGDFFTRASVNALSMYY